MPTHLPRCVLAALAVTCLVAAAPCIASAEARTAEISGSVAMLDDESGRDTRVTEAFADSTEALDTPFLTGVDLAGRHCASGRGHSICPFGGLFVPVYRLGDDDSPCAGGEVRVRLTVTARTFLHSPGWILADVDARLYEGIDCDTGDLDGRRRYQVWIVPHGAATLNFRVRNTDEGGDYADFRFTIRNRA